LPNLSTDEKLQLIEQVLKLEENTVTEDTQLSDLPEWDSLNILNLLIEISVRNPELTFDELHGCATAGEICDKF
jgi:acyl carrier protein